MSIKRAKELERRFQREAKRMLELAEEADRDDKDDGFHLPAELARREDRIRAIKEAQERIRSREKQRVEDAKEQLVKNADEQRAIEEANGRRFDTPRRYDRVKPNPNPQINLTDEDSRVMRTNDGFIQAYNGQIAVDCGSMLVLAAHITQSPTDVAQLKPVLQALKALPIGKPTALLADAGYFSELNVERCVAAGIKPFISVGREEHHWSLKHWKKSTVPKKNASALALMRYRLKTRAGRKIYA